MPVYPLRFTRWEAPRESARWAWWHLAAASLRVRRGSRVIRYVRVFWGFYFALFLAATYLAERRSEISWMRDLAQGPLADAFAVILHAPTRLFAFLASPPEVLTLIIVGLYAGAGLVADDRRTGALALYLSKPVSKTQYLASRIAVVAVYIGWFSIFPALGLLLFGVLISGDTLAALKDLVLVPGLLAYWVVLTVLFGLSVLVISSFTRRGRTAGVVFVILWFLSDFAGNVFDLVSTGKWGTLVDLDRMVAATGLGLLRPEGEGLVKNIVEELVRMAAPSWALTAVAVYAAVGLAVLWLRIRPGEENR